LVSGPMILDERVRLEDIGADLVAPGDVLLAAGEMPQLLLFFFAVVRPELGAENLHREVAVAMLRSLRLRADHDPGGNVGDPDRGLGLVDVLSPRSARAES